MNELSEEQRHRCERAQTELHEVLERYAVTLSIDLITYSRPVVFLVCNEDIDRPRIH